MPLVVDPAGKKVIRSTNQQLLPRAFVVLTMIGSLITSMKGINSFSSTFSRSTRSRFSPTVSLSHRSTSIFARFAKGESKNSNGSTKGGNSHEYVDSQQVNSNDTSLLIPSIAAMSTVTAATAFFNENDLNNVNNSTMEVAQCQPPDDKTPTHKVFPEELLFHDTYNGITIDIAKFPKDNSFLSPNDVEQFINTLTYSLQQWKDSGKRGIWIHIPTEYSKIIPKCIDLGFNFHFAKNGILVLTKWLPEDTESRLPHGPTHQIGVGVVVVHPLTNKILVVQEKTGPAAARKLWKMPTGLLDPGEDISVAALREAKEETGLDCTFHKIICMRQAHGGLFNQSDMFVVCSLHLASKYHDLLKEKNDSSSEDDIELIAQEEEIADIAWMDVDEFANQSLWQLSPLYKELNGSIQKFVKNDCDDGQDQPGLIAKTLPVGFRSGEQTIYLSM